MKKFKFYLFTVGCIIICTLKISSKDKLSSTAEQVIAFYDSPWVEDTIDFSFARVFISAPELSVKYSREQIFDGHGKSVYYPLKYTSTKQEIWETQVLYIEYITMTSYDSLVTTDSIDIELWNTFNSSHRGSRCYLKDGNYTRIDILDPGIVMSYENLESHMAILANQIINSTVFCHDKDKPIFNMRKSVPTIE